MNILQNWGELITSGAASGGAIPVTGCSERYHHRTRYPSSADETELGAGSKSIACIGNLEITRRTKIGDLLRLS